MRSTFLPFALPEIDNEELLEIKDSLSTNWITTGPKTKLFEQNFGDYVSSKFAIAVSSCTAGLHLALVAANIGEGDEVITTPYTFASTASVILHVGARPVFVDIEKDGFHIDVKMIEKSITPRTRAIIPVHFAGEPCRMEEIKTIAKKHNLLVIEDAAHAVGAEYKGEKIGSIGDITVFSFYAIKNMTTGEGGMVTTNNESIADKISLLALHGISKDAWKRYTSEGSWYYEILFPGFKYNMTDIQAAIGIHQLRKLNHFIKLREKYAELYNKHFRNIPEILIPRFSNDIRHAWHLYVIRLCGSMINERNSLIKAINAAGIGTSVHFIPLHLHPYYKSKFGYKIGDFPNAENTYKKAISLPLYPKMKVADIERVVFSVKQAIAQLKGSTYVDKAII